MMFCQAGKIAIARAFAFVLLSNTLITAKNHASPPVPLPVAPDFHIFYGSLPSGSASAPTVVFVHGLGGTASDWWVNNEAYTLAFEAGYKTAFVSLSTDNSRNQESIEANAAVLKDAIPKISTRLGTDLILVCHSKGALDAQAALLDTDVAGLVHSVFTIASPNHGTELADWAFGPGQDVAKLLGLLTPGVESLKTDNIAVFRAQADPYFETAGIRFFTLAGTTDEGNPLTVATGKIMDLLVDDEVHDGMVSISRTRLPFTYAHELGQISANHFAARKGAVNFGRIYFQIESFNDPFQSEFQVQIADGFGDPANTWAWSMKWFQGKLYVGTGRAFQCVGAATSDVQQGTDIYPPANSDCPPDFRDLALAAVGTNRPTELIRIDPDDVWEVVVGEPRFTLQGYKAPSSGLGTGFGNFFNGHFWQMANYQENLYLGTWDWGVGLRNLPVTKNLLPLVPNLGSDFLRTDDGVHWTFLSRNGLGDALNWGVRSLETTPLGPFIGTAKPTGPTEIWLRESASEFVESSPERLESVSSLIVDSEVILSWEEVPGAEIYEIYRSTVNTAGSFFSEVSNNPIFARIGLSPAFEKIAETVATDFQESPPTEFQSLYIVHARNANGNLSLPSNVAGGPSKGVPVSFATLGQKIASLNVRGYIRLSIEPFSAAIVQSKALIQEGDFAGCRQHLEDLKLIMEGHRGAAIDDWAMDEVNVLIERLIRNVDLVEKGLIPLDPLL